MHLLFDSLLLKNFIVKRVLLEYDKFHFNFYYLFIFNSFLWEIELLHFIHNMRNNTSWDVIEDMIASIKS